MSFNTVHMWVIGIIFLYTCQCNLQKYPRDTMKVHDEAVTVGKAGNVALWMAPSAKLNEKLGTGKGWYVDFYNYPLNDIPWAEDGEASEYVYRFIKDPKTYNLKENFEFWQFRVDIDNPVTADEYEMDKFEWVEDNGKLLFYAGIKLENMDDEEDVQLTADEAAALEGYRAELKKILTAQSGTPKFYVKQNKFDDVKEVDTKVYLSPFHARHPHNEWILMEQDKITGKYHIPLLSNIKGYQVNEGTNTLSYVKDAKTKGTVKFAFDRDHTKKVTITIDGTITYDIYWFQQQRGQCVLHALQAILQDDTTMINCNYFHRLHMEFMKEAVDVHPMIQKIFNKQQWDHCKKGIGVFGNFNNEFYTSYKPNDNAMTNGKACLGFFDTCVLETILTGWNHKFTLALLEKPHLNSKTWSQQYALMVKGNPQPFAIWLRVIRKSGEAHSLVFREIKASSGGGKAIWINLDSYANPAQVKIPGDLDTKEFGDIQSLYLVYKGSQYYKIMKGWVKYPVGKTSSAYSIMNENVMDNKEDDYYEHEYENEYGELYDEFDKVNDYQSNIHYRNNNSVFYDKQQSILMILWILTIACCICGLCVAVWSMIFGYVVSKAKHSIYSKYFSVSKVEIAENV